MASPVLSSRDFIQKCFSPFVAVLTSSLVEEICQKNHLSFIELLEPFCQIQKDVCFKDPSNSIITIKNLQVVLCDVNSKPPEAAVARRLLNESVSAIFDDNVEYVPVKSGNINVEIPASVPWFENWRTTFFKVQFPSDHEFTKHYIACMIVITSQDDNPMDTLSNKVQQLQQMLSMSPPKMMPKWFSSSILRYYVLLHDVLSGDLKKAEKVYEEMKSTYSANCCYMLQINSSSKGINTNEYLSYWSKFTKEKEDIRDGNDANMTDSVISQSSDFTKIETGFEISEQSKSKVINHPLSSHLGSQGNINIENMNGLTDEIDSLQNVEIRLLQSDIDNIKALVSNFIINALIPFVETQIQYLNEVVFNKKVVSKSIFSVPKRWFGGPKPGSPVSVPNAHYYHPDSPELQMRRLGDLCFLFGAYTAAFHAYHSVKRDFNNDGAWLYYAGALEMAALSSFLIGQDIKKAQEYTEESIVTYLHTCRMPQFATRLTLCASECLKNLNMFGEAAARLLLMTNEDSDLRSALLLEEASYCFIKSRKPPMPRKYAFHLVLAGHRFLKASQKNHSLRCYRQAYQVYKEKNWSLAEDHIHFTVGKLASSLKQKEVTAAELAQLFKRPSTQLPANQATFLREYFLSLITLENEDGKKLPFLEVPHVNHSSIKVALNIHQNENLNDCILAGKQISEEELSDSRWWKLEENLISFSSNSSTPLFFKPSVNVFSNCTNNSVKPTCVVGEQIRTSVDLVNILGIPLLLKKVELMWIHSSQSDNLISKNDFAETEVLDSVSLAPDSCLKVSLHISPKIAGDLHITGIIYTVVLQSLHDSAESISICGHTLLSPQGMRIISTKDQKTAPVYMPDYRLQLVAVNNAPRLKIYLKNLPSEMLCGEVKKIHVVLQNVGMLPITSVLFSSSKPNSFSVPNCMPKNNVFTLLRDPIQPGHSVEDTILIRGCDKSGRVSIDLLFYYDTEKSSQQKLKYRLIYHTLHLLIHESLFSSALVSRSIKLNEENNEGLNIRLQVQNKNQIYDSLKFTMYLHRISLYSSHWHVYDAIFSNEGAPISLEQEQVAFITLKAKRVNNCDFFSDVILNTAEENAATVNKQFKDFTLYVIKDIISKNGNIHLSVDDWLANQKGGSAISLNSVLILSWKAEVKNLDVSSSVVGQHHLPILKLGQRYTTLETNDVIEVQNSLDSKSIFIPPSISDLYCASTDAKDLILVKMKHPAFVNHSFSENRICSVDVELILQNCCDTTVEVKLDATNQGNNNISKVSESSAFLWMGLVLHTLMVNEHSCVTIPVSVCVGNSGTYDLASQLNILARKSNADVFVPQSGISHSLLCVSTNIL